MATDQPQPYCFCTWIAGMPYYHYGEFQLNEHTDFQTMKKVSSLLDDPRTSINIVVHKSKT